MEIKKIVDYINRSYIASERLRVPDVYYYMDLVIDDINDRLQAKFPTFTDWEDFVARWNAWVAGPNPVPGEGMPPKPEEPEEPDEERPKPPVPPRPHRPMPGIRPIPTNSPYGPHLFIEPVPFIHGMHPMFLRDNTKYDAFPDTYIRSVVALGVAVKFYTRDEEGEQIAADYQQRYEMALFKMTRDYHNQVPWYFQNNRGGFIDFSYNREEGPWDLVPRGMVLRGDDTKVL